MLNLRIDEESGSRVVPVPQAPAVLGRGDDVEIRLEELKASRRHLEIRPAGAGVVIRDLGSTNGTFTEDRRIVKARLAPGDSFRIGDTWLTVEVEAPRVLPPRKNPLPTILLTLFAPALILLILGELGLNAVASGRQKKIDAAIRRIELVEFELARNEPDSRKSVAALTLFTERHPQSPYAPDALRRRGELAAVVTRLDTADRELEDLSAGADRYVFEELYYRYEKLLETYQDMPEVARRIGDRLAGLDRSHREKLVAMVQSVRNEVTALAATGDYGRALSVMTSFTMRTPAAAARFKEEIREAEAELMRRAEKAYRELTTRAEELTKAGKGDEAAALLRKEASRFLGIRFSSFLRLRADGIESRGRPTGEKKETVDQLALRRSYYILAQEAEELAAAGLFTKAATKYENILASITLPGIKEEFTRRFEELGRLSALIDDLRSKIRERGEKFGTVELSGARYKVVALSGDSLKLEISKQPVSRQWSSLEPEELLALFKRARLSPEQRLDLAVYCFDVNLGDAFRAEILAALEVEDLREKAGKLYAWKEGIRYPNGGFVAYKGRILTGAEYAEEVHKEQVVKLRKRQGELLRKIEEHQVFKKLAKLRNLRLELDKARTWALALIFDEQKYFYPYRDRMAEYVPVQEEVDVRVAAVTKIWENPLKITLKSDRSLTLLLEEADASVETLRELGIDPTEFAELVANRRLYIGRSLSIRNYFHNRDELELFEYNHRVLLYNVDVKSIAQKLERRQVEITNEYRLMMGRRALVLDDRLVQTARGHSDEMSRLGYFSHFSPTASRKTPDMRARLSGYKGTALSENIHAGSGTPEGAHYGWLHSSGHHRNILQKFWTEMGTGQVGRYWTQNFGRTKPMTFSEEEKERK
jgi:uncharacterized protein YkwD